jgi:5-methylcytosine-specific restriction protein A
MRTLKDKRESNGRTLALDSTAWRKLRASVLRGEPLCRHCQARGLIVPATEVDHRNGPSDNSLESLQPLCKPCHSKQTMRDMGHNVYQWDAMQMGCRFDPSHPWNKEKSPATDSHKPTGYTSFSANCNNLPKK